MRSYQKLRYYGGRTDEEAAKPPTSYPSYQIRSYRASALSLTATTMSERVILASGSAGERTWSGVGRVVLYVRVLKPIEKTGCRYSSNGVRG